MCGGEIADENWKLSFQGALTPGTGRLRWVGHYILSPESLDCMTGDPKATSAVPEKELLELTQYTVFDLHLFLWVNHLFTFLKLREIKSRTLQELL